MRLTTAKYYTPSHRTIHEHGVEPNIISTLTTKDELEINKWRASHSTGEAAALELASLGDRQLERAVDALKGVLVYAEFAKSTAPAPTPAPTAKPTPKTTPPLSPSPNPSPKPAGNSVTSEPQPRVVPPSKKP
jgi:carboxyl-terminal processing protease